MMITSLSYLVFIRNHIRSNWSQQFSYGFQHIPDLYNQSYGLVRNISCLVWLTTSLSCLVFIIEYTQFDWSRKFNILFIIERTTMISQVIVLSSFHHRRHPVWSVMTIQYHFWSKTDSCPVGVSVDSCPAGVPWFWSSRSNQQNL